MKPEDIIQVSQNIKSMAVFLRVSRYVKSGRFIEALIMVYVTETSKFYISKKEMR